MSSLLAEFKRRNVFKVATIYVIVSWLVLQVVDTVFPVFDFPIWTTQLVVILMGLGFPVAIILAWAFDLTPEGIQWQGDVGEHHVHTHAWDWVVATLLVVAIGLMVKDQLDAWGVTARNSPVTAEVEQSVPPVIQNLPENVLSLVTNSLASVVVLPFDNRSPDAENDYIADGLADELLGVLGRISEIKVASRTSTAYYKNKEVDNLTIAATLKVDHVLSGSVRRVGDQIVVIAALDRAGTGEQLWTETYDRTLDDILFIQRDIAESVALAIVPVLSPESENQIKSQPTLNTEAYDFYLRGRDYLRQPAEETTLASAMSLFDRAINLDPRFAEAYAGRCEANLGSFEYTRNSSYFESAEISCIRALTLNNSLWGVRLALGNLYRINGQNDKAVIELEAAIKLQPNAVSPYLTLAVIYTRLDKPLEAEIKLKRAEEVESGYWRVHNEIGHFYSEQLNYAEAIRSYTRVAELAPDHGIGQDNLGNTYLSIGDFSSAEKAFNDSPLPSRWTFTNRGLVYYYQGEYARAIEDQKRAIELAPEFHSAWGRLGDSYRYVPGREQDMQAAYVRAIELAEQEFEINPSSWTSVVRLATYYAKTGQASKAETKLGELFELTQNDTTYYFAAIASLALGDRDRALDYLRESINRGFSKVLILADPDLAEVSADSALRDIMSAP